MKKVAKALLIFLLMFAVGTGGFFLGQNTGDLTDLPQVSETGSDQEILQRIEGFRKTIKENYLFDYTEEDLETGIYKGLFAGLNDPYSVYYTGDEFKRLMEDTSGEFSGIGVVVSAGTDGYITIVSPIEGTPGAKAGLQAGDKIVEINGKPYFGKDLEEATSVMRGKEGTDVTLTIQREKEKKDVTITRALVHIESVEGEMLADDIAYIRITSFDQDSAKSFKEKLDSLTKSGAKGLILDLRNNPGGLLSSCLDIADALLGEGTIVTTVSKNGEEQVETSDAEYTDIPIVVLVNGGSASASEILLGALRDHNRATSVGEKTFGKGIVQQIYPLGMSDEHGGFKLTVSEYLTPNGEKIHDKGIVPDTIRPLDVNAKGMGPDYLEEDNQLEEALKQIKEKL